MGTVLAGFLAGFSIFLLSLVGLFMILIILLQRGRGGGLAGAFGGMGGQSAFGTKAGDVFTKITIGIAVVWVILAGLSGFALQYDISTEYPGGAAVEERLEPGQPPTGEQGAEPATGTDTGENDGGE